MPRPHTSQQMQGFDGSKNLLEASIEELQRQLIPDNQAKRVTEEEANKQITLKNFVESTSNLRLEPWQDHLCERLQKLTYQTGQRLLIHKPPQHGGSVIVSQRLPAYLIGTQPATRVRLACYNIEQAKRFTSINKKIMTSGEYKTLFHDRGLYVNPLQSDEEFYTKARLDARDAQASVRALGLSTGFVGSGADTLIVDDPYASPLHAESEAILKATWSFWEESASARIDEFTNVLFMFHRYNEEDIVGQLIAEDGLKSKGGTWELISYRAEWDGDTRLEVGGEDPMNREVGEYLSPRKAAQPDYYEKKKRSKKMWQSQFQGKPSNAEGSFFLVNEFKIVPRVVVSMQKVVLAWDIASSVNGDWTVGALLGLGSDELVYVLDIVRFRKNTNERNAEMLLFASLCRVKYPDLIVRVPQDPAAAGKDLVIAFQKLFKGFNLKVEGIRGDKEIRADPWSQYVNAGNVRLVSGSVDTEKWASWIKIYVDEHRKFPNSVKKDQVDASSDAFAELTLYMEEAPGEDFDTAGIAGGDFALDSDLLNTEEAMLAEIAGFELYGVNIYDNKNYEEEISSKGYSEEELSGTTDLSTLRARKNVRQAKERRFYNTRTN